MPDLGRVGEVGTIDVDVTSGLMVIPSDLATELEHKAEVLAKRLPPYQPKSPVPEKYHPPHIPPAPTIVLDDDGFPTVVTSPTPKTG